MKTYTVTITFDVEAFDQIDARVEADARIKEGIPVNAIVSVQAAVDGESFRRAYAFVSEKRVGLTRVARAQRMRREMRA